jgi:UDP-N-acetyl-D-glucosamine dehydrogenase
MDMEQEQGGFGRRIADRTAVAGVVGLGYVGLPLAVETGRSGFRVIGVDKDRAVVDRVNRGESHIGDVEAEQVRGLRLAGLLEATVDASRLGECDVVSICVPTPLSKIKDPDLSYVVAAAESVALTLRRGQLIILESTTYPGTTREVVLPILQRTGLKVGRDFFLCFSPERVDPGNAVWKTRNTPKVLGGITPACTQAGMSFYDEIFDEMVPVESAEAAELVKVYENTFRMINIALVNELAQVCDRLGVDVWGVVEAAATKPFGFMKFTPGPGLGGHCIPLDPHYLSWKMRTLAFRTRMIELASEINGDMPAFVVRKVAKALNDDRLAVNGSRILILGVAYKRDIDDLRETPAFEIMRLLQQQGADVAYHDPLCPVIQEDGLTPLAGLPMYSIPLDEQTLAGADCVVVVTDHTSVDYQLVARCAKLVVDTRGVIRDLPGNGRIVGLSGTMRSAFAVPRAVGATLADDVIDGTTPAIAAPTQSPAAGVETEPVLKRVSA